MNKKFIGLGLASVALVSLAACGHRGPSKSDSKNAKTDLKVAIVTDTGGVDDKSFNQSAWEGLQSWGKKMGLKKGAGFNYFQSNSESEYATNLDTAAADGYKVVYGIGFALKDAIAKAATDNKETKYVIIDDVIEGKDNVASVTFADNEAAYLAGIAAAKTTKTKVVGFIGGMKGTVITRFEKGFQEGVKSVDSSIKVKVDYAGSFGDAAKGKTIAAAQYASGADIIYQAAGGTGAGVFNEAKARNEKKTDAEKVWVIGVDRDQKDEGNFTSKDGKKSNFVLASSIKKVGKSVQLINKLVVDKKFPGGKTTVYGLKDGGVDIATTNLSDDTIKAIKEAKEKIISGNITVPDK
ncbi:BMP family lipoprotein [Streptococcus pseudoporcinus]|uniref:Basic membrane protein n=2 Tax=Streptococcus pseudoporcinus TaxID=361101 RepID=G5KBZ1_9STRE|nr:BMP family protein [Streptococcus pseudoporcinus]EFR44665.1 basic membrane protein [Streptococcus pseudoporcinus SPIN 20026]EHI64845.1 basic membrane protein [Streptococcus pseudoporcinus LQ 940-04]VEF92988.1 lipoprotein [Streptococcus pseudoporcinus]VTS14805.1 lipoprotein [Streptococcus pseudoporcinus]VUC67376.1 lipoprotein [Streptococcus pseudoporcinus]